MREGFIEDAQARLDQWLAEAPFKDATPQMPDWLYHSFYNLTMFIHRPSLIEGNPSMTDYGRCFSAASNVLRMYTRLHQKNGLDCTWMALHWFFSCGRYTSVLYLGK